MTFWTTLKRNFQYRRIPDILSEQPASWILYQSLRKCLSCFYNNEHLLQHVEEHCNFGKQLLLHIKDGLDHYSFRCNWYCREKNNMPYDIPEVFQNMYDVYLGTLEMKIVHNMSNLTSEIVTNGTKVLWIKDFS